MREWFMVSSFEGINKTESTENPSDKVCPAIGGLHLLKTAFQILPVEEQIYSDWTNTGKNNNLWTN